MRKAGDIHAAIKRDALFKNVTVDANGKIDFALIRA